MGLFSSSKNKTNNTSIFTDSRKAFTDSFNTDIEFEDNRDLSTETEVEIGDNNIFTQGNVFVERLDKGIVEAALKSNEKVLLGVASSNERVVTGALNKTTDALKDLSEESQNNFARLTETIGNDAEAERQLAIDLTEASIDANRDALSQAFNSTVGGLAEIQSENTKVIVTAMIVAMAFIFIFTFGKKKR